MSLISGKEIPFFSVIIPCYKQADLLPEALDSLLEQKYESWEAIVINDGSPDDTTKVVESYSAKDARIRVVEKENGGLSSARNAGLVYAGGSIIHFMDADDSLLPGCYSTVAKAVALRPDAQLFQTGYHYCYGPDSKVLHTVKPALRAHLLPGILEGNAGPVHSLFVRREAVAAAGCFDETLRSAEDWDFWMRVAKSGFGSMHVIPEALVDYRMVDDSMSRNAFVMYDALKTVLLRAPLKDYRIVIDARDNKAYPFDIKPSLQRMLLMCLGVSVMQGKIGASADLFRKESEQYGLSFDFRSFGMMCSYLSFRYRYDEAFTMKVLTDIQPYFDQFFAAVGYNKFYRSKLRSEVFRGHLQMNRHRKFGILAPVLNQLAALRQRFL